METNYKRIDIKGSMYEESQKRGCLAMLIQKNPCCSHIKRVEKLLFDYKKERCRLASFVYPIAKHITGNNTLKRVAIAMEKERFCIDKFKKIYEKIESQQNYFSRIICAKFSIIGVASGLMLLFGIGASIYPSFSTIPHESLYLPMLAISVAVGTFLTTFIVLIYFSLYIDNIHRRELKKLIAEDYPKYFGSIYDRLQFVRKEGELFLYEIEEGIGAEKAYTLARHIYKANESRVAICKESPADPLLANMV